MADPISLTVHLTPNDRVAIEAGREGTNGAQSVYRFAPAQPKPCVHPITTPAGHRLTGFEMSDHVWHRGLWFTIKFVNGTNFWEEHPPFGVQVSRTQPACAFDAGGAAVVTHELDWTSDATGLAIREARRMRFAALDGGIGVIDWETRLTAEQDLTLDRTPYTTWGGYGGLSFRASRELHDASFHLPDGSTAAGLAGQPHDWVALHASVDGGRDQRVAIAMIDHPQNPRSPSPWYCKTGNGFTYINAAFLFHEPLQFAKGQSLHMRYRFAYRDGLWGNGEVAALAGRFREENRA